MKFFEATTIIVNAEGFVRSRDTRILESDIHDAVKGAEKVAEDLAMRWQRKGWDVFWDFEETAFKTVGTHPGNIGSTTMYVKVKEL